MKITNEFINKYFVTEISKIVEKKIAKKYDVSLTEAKRRFESSKTYAYLNSDDPFIEEGPEDFWDWYQNEQKYGKIISSTEIYCRKHFPEEYARVKQDEKLFGKSKLRLNN